MPEEDDADASISSLQINDSADDGFNIFANYDNTVPVIRETNIQLNNARLSLNDRLMIEIQRYKQSHFSSDPQNTDILGWWNLRAVQLPLLSHVAQFVFANPASSSATENNFSIAGFIFSDRRTNMKPEKLESLLILRSNKDIRDRKDNGYNSHDETRQGEGENDDDDDADDDAE